MQYIIKSNPSGAYPPPQIYPAPGLIPLTDEQAAMVVQYNGFVTITEETDEAGALSYKVEPNTAAWEVWKATQPDPLEGKKAEKEEELSAACNAAIVAGMDVETSQGTEHFSLEETDQINLTTALSAVQAGAASYPYHADGQLCRMFTAAEIQAIAQASIQHKLYHTTLCNHLLTWARRAETQEELEGITYTTEGLPEDLASNMAQVLAETAATGDPTDKEVSA